MVPLVLVVLLLDARRVELADHLAKRGNHDLLDQLLSQLRVGQLRQEPEQRREVVRELRAAVVSGLSVLPHEVREELTALVVFSEQHVADVERRDRLHVERACVELLQREQVPARNELEELLDRARGRRTAGQEVRVDLHHALNVASVGVVEEVGQDLVVVP